jgi:hypothetical protein
MKRVILLLVAVPCLLVAWTTPSAAQGPRGRARSVVIVRGAGGNEFWFDPWYGYPFGYAYPVGYGYPYPYYREQSAALRIEVTPRDAEVYIDGYYAGIVDDFDGVFQRLRVPPGDHEIALYLSGFRSVTQHLYLPPETTFRLKYRMEPLAPGETSERPAAPAPPLPPAGAEQQPPQQLPRQPMRGPDTRRLPPPPDQGSVRANESSAYGTLVVQVQPEEAVVLIDGERWQGPRGQERLVVQLAEGAHRVQVQKDGYEPFVNDIQIRRGDTTPLNVSLRRQP